MTDTQPTATVKAVDTSMTSPASTSAGSRVFAIPHIVASIIQYASRDRSTLARLMRLDKNFYKEIAPLLYHTVAIWEETIDSFFLGSYKPCHCEECLTELKEKWGIDHANGGITEWGQQFSKPHKFGKYTNPAPKPKAPTKAANKTPEASPSKSSTASSPGPKTPKDDKLVIPDNEGKKIKKDQPTKKTENDDKPKVDGGDDKPEIKLPISKTDLLRMVRVLTLGGHHESACEIHAPQVEEFLQGVEILRIVETPCAPHRTFHICENIPGGSCPMIDALNPRKIVVRNVSGHPVPFHPMWKANDKTKEMVFVLPTKLMSYSGADGCPSEELLNSLHGQFTEVNVIRVVFWPDWDDSLTHHPLARKLVNDTEAARIKAELGSKPLHVDYISEIMHALTKTRRLDPFDFRRPRVHFYGFGTTTLSAYGKSALVEDHKKHNPNGKYDLHSLAKRSAIRKEIGYAANQSGGGFVYGCCDEVNWYTLANYERKKFKSEITEWDNNEGRVM